MGPIRSIATLVVCLLAACGTDPNLEPTPVGFENHALEDPDLAGPDLSGLEPAPGPCDGVCDPMTGRLFLTGTPLTVADFLATAAWGTGAAVLPPTFPSVDQAGTVTVSVPVDACDMGACAANPILKLTFHDGPFPHIPHCLSQLVSSSDTSVWGKSPIEVVSAGFLVMRLVGTPVGGKTYTFTWHCFGTQAAQ